MNKPGRNDSCPCGSQKKYKQCCMRQVDVRGDATAAPAISSAQLLQLAFARHRAGYLDEAQAVYRDVVKREPRNAAAWHLNGIAAGDRGDHAAAIEYIGRAIALDAGTPDFHANLGRLFTLVNRHADAENCYRRALALKADGAYYDSLGTALREQGKIAAAETAYRRAIAFNPGQVGAHRNLGDLLQLEGRHGEALGHYYQALALQPDLAEVHSNIGTLLLAQGDFAAAIGSFQHALIAAPDNSQAYDNLLYASSIHCAPSVYLDAARRRGGQLRALAQSHPDFAAQASRSGDPLPDDAPTALRIGLLSGDFRNHPVGIFLENIVAQLHATRLELFAYPTIAQSDALTARIKPYFAAWHSLGGLSDADAARLIRADRIHILIDLSGYTAHNRLALFAWRPAPVQVCWLGYWASTGIDEIDYVLADRYSLPPAEATDFCEKPWYLPDTRLCFTPPCETIAVTSLPAATNGYITFGCFNNSTKLNDAVVALWSRILRRADNARLLLKSKQFADVAQRDHMHARFAAHGIDPTRILLQGESPRADYFTAYNDVDIALDPFPFNGGTTSVDGLWMGVPFVALRGDRMIAHQGESILHNVGLADWITDDADAYVEAALRHVADPQRLALLRGELRARLLASPLCDAVRFAAHLQGAFAGMWRAHLQAISNHTSAD